MNGECVCLKFLVLISISSELSDLEDRREKLTELIRELPSCNMATLHYLMTFLKLVTLNSEVNKMHSLNLGVVFAPTILRRKVETKVGESLQVFFMFLNSSPYMC